MGYELLVRDAVNLETAGFSATSVHIHQVMRRPRANWYSGNSLELHSADSGFESRLRHRPSWFSSVSERKCWNSTTIRPRPFLSTSYSNQSFVYHTTVLQHMSSQNFNLNVIPCMFLIWGLIMKN